jgi:dTDP-glucose 4,6-dehydratase
LKPSFDWVGRKALVTGAGGFLGSHLAEHLVKLGATTRAMVRYTSSGTWGWLDQSSLRGDMDVIAGDIRDPWSAWKALEDVDTVFHLAALIGIPYSYTAPHAYLETNTLGTLNILEAARRLGTRRVVCTSTSEVYGTAHYVPLDEQHPLQGQSPYSASKIASDKMAQAYHLSFDLPVVTARPFNTYGPRQSARAVIPAMITQALAGERVKVGSLLPTRDFNFVSDIVKGFAAIGSSGEGTLGEEINLGSGREVAVHELAAMIGRLLGKRLDIEEDTARLRPGKSEVNRLCADATKANNLLDWHSYVTLEEGLARTIEWIEKNMSSYRSQTYAT